MMDRMGAESSADLTTMQREMVKGASQIAAGLTVKATGHDMQTATNAAGNAVEHNLFWVPVMVAIGVGLKVADVVTTALDAKTLGEGLAEDDQAKIAEGATGLAISGATSAIPGAKAGISLAKAGAKKGLKSAASAAESGATHAVPAGKSLTDRAARKANILQVGQKPGTSKRAFDKKVGALQDAAKRGELKVVKNPARDPQLTAKYRKALNNKIDKQYGTKNPAFAAQLKERLRHTLDIDHIIELQLGGRDAVSNFRALEKPINRSLGPQFQKQIKHLPDGAKIDRVIVKPR